MIFVGYFDGGNGADIRSGKLSLVDHTDLITGYNAVFAFKPCLGNIKYIVFSIAGNRQVCTVKIQQCDGKLIYINTFFRGRLLIFLFCGI